MKSKPIIVNQTEEIKSR